MRVHHAADLFHPVYVHAELGHAIDLGVVQARDDVRPRCRVEYPGLGSNAAQRLTVVVTDVYVGAQGLHLSQLIGRNGHAVLAATNEEEIHEAPILYKDTVSYRARLVRTIADQRLEVPG